MKHIFLLHGATGSKDQLQPLAAALNTTANIHLFNFSGHGGEPLPAEPFSIKLFAANVLHYMEQHALQQADVFGYSMGGYVGMYLARHNPEKVTSLVTLATKFQWDEATAAKEIKMLQPEVIEKKLPEFAAGLEKRHTPQNWKMILQKTADMLWDMGRENPLKPGDYDSISLPVLLMLGDRDKMVSQYETMDVYNKLPAARLSILPNTPHAIEKTDVSMLSFMIRNFLKKV